MPKKSRKPSKRNTKSKTRKNRNKNKSKKGSGPIRFFKRTFLGDQAAQSSYDHETFEKKQQKRANEDETEQQLKNSIRNVISGYVSADNLDESTEVIYKARYFMTPLKGQLYIRTELRDRVSNYSGFIHALNDTIGGNVFYYEIQDQKL
jgi:hypothetical protein